MDTVAMTGTVTARPNPYQVGQALSLLGEIPVHSMNSLAARRSLVNSTDSVGLGQIQVDLTSSVATRLDPCQYNVLGGCSDKSQLDELFRYSAKSCPLDELVDCMAKSPANSKSSDGYPALPCPFNVLGGYSDKSLSTRRAR